MQGEKLLTVPEVAEALRVKPEAIRRWLRSGRLAGVSMGSDRGGWRIKESEVRRFLDRMESRAPTTFEEHKEIYYAFVRETEAAWEAFGREDAEQIRAIIRRMEELLAEPPEWWELGYAICKDELGLWQRRVSLLRGAE